MGRKAGIRRSCPKSKCIFFKSEREKGTDSRCKLRSHLVPEPKKLPTQENIAFDAFAPGTFSLMGGN